MLSQIRRLIMTADELKVPKDLLNGPPNIYEEYVRDRNLEKNPIANLLSIGLKGETAPWLDFLRQIEEFGFVLDPRIVAYLHPHSTLVTSNPSSRSIPPASQDPMSVSSPMLFLSNGAGSKSTLSNVLSSTEQTSVSANRDTVALVDAPVPVALDETVASSEEEQEHAQGTQEEKQMEREHEEHEEHEEFEEHEHAQEQHAQEHEQERDKPDEQEEQEQDEQDNDNQPPPLTPHRSEGSEKDEGEEENDDNPQSIGEMGNQLEEMEAEVLLDSVDQPFPSSVNNREQTDNLSSSDRDKAPFSSEKERFSDDGAAEKKSRASKRRRGSSDSLPEPKRHQRESTVKLYSRIGRIVHEFPVSDGKSDEDDAMDFGISEKEPPQLEISRRDYKEIIGQLIVDDTWQARHRQKQLGYVSPLPPWD